MDNLTSNLNCKTGWYQKQLFENELGETDYTYTKVKDVWAQIIPMNGSATKFGNVDPQVSAVNVSHKFKVRYLSCPNITIDSYFMYKGIRYDVVSFNQDFKSRNYMEIMTNVRYE